VTDEKKMFFSPSPINDCNVTAGEKVIEDSIALAGS